MKNLNLILLAVFGIAALFAVLLFSGIIPGVGLSGGKSDPVDLTLWGTYNKTDMRGVIDSVNVKNETIFNITYKEKNPDNYETELVNALASGAGPDLWLLPQDLILAYEDKIFPISNQYFSKRDFLNSFIEESELFLTAGAPDTNGVGSIIGMPFSVDPIVLYWNRNLFASAGIVDAPRYWSEFIATVPKLTLFDDLGNIKQSAVAFGEFRNIKNAKEILSLLMLQTGNKIIDPLKRKVVFDDRGNAPLSPVQSAIRFYTEFADPAKQNYSWNRNIGNAQELFTASKLAMYFGYASEYKTLKNQNPHLNFDVALVPQIKNNAPGVSATFGRMEAVVVSKYAKDIGAAFSATFALSGAGAGEQVVENLSLPPVRRDIIRSGSEYPIMSVFYKAAIQARGWLEPDPASGTEIFKNMVEGVSTGKLRISAAVRQAEERLQKLLR